MIAREASPLPPAARAPLQSEKIEVPDLRDCLLGEIGVPEERRVVLQSLLRCSLCRDLQLRRGLESLGSPQRACRSPGSRALNPNYHREPSPPHPSSFWRAFSRGSSRCFCQTLQSSAGHSREAGPSERLATIDSIQESTNHPHSHET